MVLGRESHRGVPIPTNRCSCFHLRPGGPRWQCQSGNLPGSVAWLLYIRGLPGLPRPEYPRPHLRRRDWTNLNGEWRFSFDQPNFDRTIIVPFAYQSTLSGIDDRNLHDTVWYRRSFIPPPADRLMLHFGAVDYKASVWVNGIEVVQHEGGHTPFAADVTSALRSGANELVVRADDPAGDRTLPRGKQFWKEVPEGIFYTATTGIWQTVWLEPLGNHHLISLRLSPQLDEGVVDFEVRASHPGTVHLEASLDGESMGSALVGSGAGRLALSRVVAWHPDAPRLYEITIRLLDGEGHEVDRVESYFGLRTVGTRDGRFLLNGEPFIQRLVLDQGYFPGGWYTAATDADLRQDIELAKSLGFNGARKHQKIEDPRWLYWADRLGFLVWAEMPNFHLYSREAEDRLAQELTAAIDRDRGHPCIVAWVPMNETFGLAGPIPEPVVANLLVRLYRLAHELDGSRPVVSNDGWEHALTDLCTLHDYGSAGDLRRRYANLQTALEPSDLPRPPYLPGFNYRGEPILVSEFGGTALAGDSGGYALARDTAELARAYGDLVDALMAKGPVEGFCYTQLTDVAQERNGLLSFDRKPKVDPAILLRLTQTTKRR